MSKILYCNNCGKQGHISNDCKIPITSVGIILLRYHENKPSYLFVRRKETFGYSDLVRGKYPIYNKTFIQNLVNEMTLNEKQKIGLQYYEAIHHIISCNILHPIIGTTNRNINN